MTDRISVIIRSMGRACLAESINSAVNQAIENIEIVVVDALGKDHPELVWREYPANIRLISTGESLSRAAAANVGLSAAQGDFLIFLDDDDLFLDGHLSGLRNTLNSHTEAIASYAGVRLIDIVGNELDVYNAPFNALNLIGNNVFPINAVLFRRASATDCIFDEGLDVYEDWDFWLQLINKGSFIHHDAVTALYRVGLSQSGLNIFENEQLRSEGRNRIYQKWKNMWTGEELNAFIESKLRELYSLKRQLSEKEKIQERLKSQLSDVERCLRDARPLLNTNLNHICGEDNLQDELESQLDTAQKLIVGYINERDEVELALKNTQEILANVEKDRDNIINALECTRNHNARIEHDRDHIENALDIAREHVARVEKDRDQLDSALRNSHDHLRLVEKDRDQMEQDRDYYHRIYLEIERSAFWRLTAPLRHSLVYVKNIIPSSGDAWRLLQWGFHKIPISERSKRGMQDWLYWKMPNLFQHLPSYQFRVMNIAQNGITGFGATDKSTPGLLLEDILPANLIAKVKLPDVRVDVIIPIYDGIDTTRRCLERVINARNSIENRIILINDSSPRPEIRSLLDALPINDHLLVFHNEKNLGFTASVNRGMSLSKDHDVVLLNSDTEVPDNWLDRLVSQAYQSPSIGTVTPFSNNATICSYPKLPGESRLPDGETLDSLDALIGEVNRGRNTDLPTAIGFCMYIKRRCLSSVGLFDVETFGKGYGEENDFCLRAERQGWRHILAADLFVFHAGEVSFGAGSNPAKQKAAGIIRERYPNYEVNVADFVRRDPARPWRLALTAARLRSRKQNVILMICHGLGGGADKHLQDLALQSTDRGARVLIMRSLPGQPHLASLELVHGSDDFNIQIPTGDLTKLAELLKAFGVSLVHIHHTMHWAIDLQALLARLGLPFLFTVHDFYTLCPRVNLMGPLHSAYCGEPDQNGCLACLKESPRTDTTDIFYWRARHAWLFHDALAIICPSRDTAARCLNYYPHVQSKIRAVYHERTPPCNQTLTDSEFSLNQPLRVAILGVLARHKGLDLVLDLARLAIRKKYPITFILIGYTTEIVPYALKGVITQTGKYTDQELHRLILDKRPHLVWFPSRCPETYSYTLTTVLNIGLPILAPRLGAFPERLQRYALAWGYDLDATTTELLTWFERFKGLRLKGAWPETDEEISFVHPVAEDASWYANNYLALPKGIDGGSPFDLTHDPNSVIVISEQLGSHPSPCGYIRLILPLASNIQNPSIRFASPVAALHYRVTTVVTQRLAFQDRLGLDELLKKVQQESCRLIYDLDDDLLALDNSHGEAEHYRRMKGLVTELIRHASEVWISTPELADRISGMNGHSRIVPNRLSKILWRLSENESSEEEPLRILYMGTKTHAGDWRSVEPALKRVIHRHGSMVEMHIVGIDEDNRLPSWAILHQPPPGVAAVYPAFVHWLQGLVPFTVGIAPLMPDTFNIAKSGIKFMDYTALGAVTLASDLPPYQEVIRNGENGILIPGNSSKTWEEALELVIGSQELRRRLLIQARQDWLLHHSYDSWSEELSILYPEYKTA